MPIDRKSAEEIIALFEKANALCNSSLKTVMRNESLGHVNVYGRLAGEFMGNLYTNIIAPLWKEFPDLEPVEMKGAYSESDPALSPESQAALRELAMAARLAIDNTKRLVPKGEEVFAFGGLPEVEKKMSEIESFLEEPRVRAKK